MGIDAEAASDLVTDTQGLPYDARSLPELGDTDPMTLASAGGKAANALGDC